MSLRQHLRTPVVLTVALITIACGGSPTTGSTSTPPPAEIGSGNLNGAGATFPEPFYTQAFYQYNQKYPNISVNYQAIGSGGGIKQFTAGTVDFGASDVPMTDAELTAAGSASSLVEVPTILGVVSIAYNLPSVSKLQLDGTTLANIFLGKIKNWDDAAIASQNSGVALPSKPITVVHRSDNSGTSYQFTDYLAKVSPDWKAGPGVGKGVSWPAGVGASGNTAVAQAVKSTDNAIGYVELAYVVQTHMQQAYLKNAAGKYLQASIAGATAAASKNTNVSPTNFSITNMDGDAAYPIASFSWIFLKKAMTDSAKGRALVFLFKWVVSDGQSYGTPLDYAPLPAQVQTYALDQLKSVTVSGATVLK
jgi:phosphate transport system substrate-binding protein